MGRALVVASALLSFLIAASAIKINVADGGYEDILVSVSPDVPYNESIVDSIKALFRLSSEFLHQATHGRVYFKQVIIELPRTWPKRASAREISESTFTKSDVRVEVPIAACGDKPFTSQVDQCGYPGDFIHLTPGFLAKTQNTAAQSKLLGAYFFVHEWAHFRYGVFDEYGIPGHKEYPFSYCIGYQVFVNGCSSNLSYSATSASGGYCRTNRKCDIVGFCNIVIFLGAGSPTESSIMFMPYVANVSKFCEKDGHRRHNRWAPNMQNKFCNQRPTWEVISGNDDFKGLPKPDMSKRIQVTFQEKQQKEDLGQRVVLVLDVSQSMSEKNRLKFLKLAVTHYISDIEDSYRLAIVTFSEVAEIRHPLMAVNAATRQGFLDTVKDLETVWATCIGCGLQTAVAVLNTSSEKPEGAVIVLFTDGDENRSPSIADVKSDIQEAKITVSTVALGVPVHRLLQELAIATKGKAYVYEDLTGNLGLQLETAFVNSVTTQVDDNVPVLTVVYTEGTIKKTFEEKFLIDGGIVNNTLVVIQPNNNFSLNATKRLVDPTGNVCHECTERAEGGGAVISLPSPAKVGTWTLHLENHSPDEVIVTIQVKSRTRGGEPILIFSRFSKATESPQNENELTVLAKVTKGKQVVLKAAVYAEVTGPEVKGRHHKSKFRLYDDGKDPDVHRNDGWYTGFFRGYVGRGKYYLSASVARYAGTRLSPCWDGSGSFFGSPNITVSDVPIPGGAPWFDVNEHFIFDNTTVEDEDTDTVEESDLLDNFTRTVYIGEFEVTSDIYDEDFPPGYIRDLTVDHVQPRSDGTLLVQLTWTWPGAHLSTGMASSVTIRASDDFTRLESNFDNQVEITSANVVEGNLDPLPPRATHVVTIALPATFASLRSDRKYDWTAYIAIRVTNSYGRSSQTSNVVYASYTSRPVETGVTATTETGVTVTAQTGVTVTTQTGMTVTTETGVTLTTETATSSKVKINTTKKVSADKEDSESTAWFVLISVCIVILVLAAVLLAIYITAVKKRIEENTLDDLLTEKTSKSQEETVTNTVG